KALVAHSMSVVRSIRIRHFGCCSVCAPRRLPRPAARMIPAQLALSIPEVPQKPMCNPGIGQDSFRMPLHRNLTSLFVNKRLDNIVLRNEPGLQFGAQILDFDAEAVE